ncbi:anthranilate synthase component I [Helicobacter pylori]|nr:anthranilate synthase component I [Helicobacter pylori]WQZ55422.1 anthranilate synthase component I [Helicobacter pylori]WQZ60972.1 anthranilate synthase component I [Helicobacter pylori]
MDDKKAFEIESEANKPLLMAQAYLRLICNHNIATTTSLTPNSGAFL